MSELKCPVCGKQMKIGTLDQDDSMGTVWMSIMPCDCVCSYGASKAVWKKFADTKKKPKYAGMILKNLLPHLNGYERLDVQKAIEQIKDKEEI